MPVATYTVTANASAASYSVAYVPDTLVAPFNIGFSVTVDTTAMYSVEHTFDDPFLTDINASVSAASWFQHEFVVSSITNLDGNYAFPVKAVRLKVFPNSQNGTATLRIVQAGSSR